MIVKNLNAVDDLWIKALDLDGNETDISFREALVHAQNYKALYGECLPQDKSIERLLRGILHKILQNYSVDGEYEPLISSDQAKERWVELWESGHFPEKPIQDYLDQYKDRFNLIDPEYPFMQVHETEKEIRFKASNNKVVSGDGLNFRTIKKLVGTIFEGSGRPRVWADQYFDDDSTLSMPEAARWLCFINSYDDASFKKPPTDIHVAFCGQMTGIYAEGTTLFETLMLNLPLANGEEVWKTCTPYWEMESFGRSQMVTPPPDNPSLLLTFPYRRMNLKIDDEGRVTGYELTGHHSFNTSNYFIEQNGVMRAPQPDKNLPVGYRKLTSDFLWQNYGDLFLNESNDGYSPGVVSWISRIVSDDFDLSIENLIFRSVTVNYKSMNCVFSEMTNDSLTMNKFLLSRNSLEWRQHIASTVNSLKNCAQQTGYFYKNLAIAGGFDPKKDSFAREGENTFWEQIDQPFREWLASIKKGNQFSNESKIKEIKDLVYDIVNQIIQERKDSATLKMAVGTTRMIKVGSSEREKVYNLQKACAEYYQAVRKCMGDGEKKQI